MAWLFSKRCKSALEAKKMKVSIPLPVRYRILRTMQNYDENYYVTDNTGFNSPSSTLEDLPSVLKTELGCKDLLAFPESGQGEAVPSNIDGFILRGNYPPLLFDATELFYNNISVEKKESFQKTFNGIMEESNLSWRMAEGQIFPVDSTYIDTNVLRKTHELLNQVKFHGALEEFEKARVSLINGEYKDAVDNANMAVESTIKGILKIEKAKPGELFRKVIEVGIIPDYFSGFLKAFETNILRCTAIIRNEELGVGHGQGAKVNKIPPPLADLAVNLSAVLINFLIKQYVSSEKSK
ncbi:MAG: abortive infection family protein [Candidatus Omnitrophica bacterium]|nr:abortive infection family protein [Candidatus Omnitrophota bacterium]